MEKTDKNLTISSKCRVLQVVREQYLRDDIPCMSLLCDLCDCKHVCKKLSAEGLYYVIPSTDNLIKYLEIFEHAAVQNVIYIQTVTTKLLHQNSGRRFFNKVRNLTKVNASNHVFFPNEHHSKTHVNATDVNYELKCIYKVAEWYVEHLQSKISVVILSESGEFKKSYGSKNNSVFVLSMEEYLHNFFNNHDEIMDLFSSLKESALINSTKDQSKLFKEHMTSTFCENGIKSGKLLVGVLNVSKHHSSIEASVQTILSNKSTEIFIFGSSNRNRAVHKDEVVIELLPRKEWRGKIKSLSNKASTNSEAVVDSCDDIVPCARVVAISERNWRDYVCIINTENDVVERKSGNRFLAIPYDRRIPKIRITTRQYEKLKHRRIVVRIDSWPSNSQYPNGHFVRELGAAGDIEVDITAILIENNISILPFSKTILAELPNVATEPDEVNRRRDIRTSHLTFSIDPIGCQDVDDTMSLRFLDDGAVEIGVNIADVSYYVLPNSACEDEARRRSTTVYMADRRYDMLPSLLSTNICSLLAGVDRYAVSVFWTLDKHFNILDVWYGRTVIHSKYKLFYETAQQIIDDKLIDSVPEFEVLPINQKPEAYSKLRECLLVITDISLHFKEKRLLKGGLQLDGGSAEVRFELNGQDNKIESMKIGEHLEVHDVVAEMMILANHWVAKKILEKFPHNSLLRRHPNPKIQKLKTIVECAKIKDIIIQTESNACLAESLNRCSNLDDGDIVVMLKKMVIRAMPKALYFSTGSTTSDNEFAHYGLALDMYTHFTSPIRRYADIIVHRLLLASIDSKADQQNPALSNTELQELCEHINENSIAAKKAQLASQELYQVQYVMQKANEKQTLKADALVSAVKSNGFVVDIPVYGLDGAIYLSDQNNRVLFFLDGDAKWLDGQLTVNQFSIAVTTEFGTQRYTVFDHVTVQIKPKISLNRAHADGLDFRMVANHRTLSALSSNNVATVQKTSRNALNSQISDEELKSVKCKDQSLYQLFCDMEKLSLTSPSHSILFKS